MRARYKLKSMYPDPSPQIPCFYLAGTEPLQVAVKEAGQHACGVAGSHQSNICTLIKTRARFKVKTL